MGWWSGHNHDLSLDKTFKFFFLGGIGNKNLVLLVLLICRGSGGGWGYTLLFFFGGYYVSATVAITPPRGCLYHPRSSHDIAILLCIPGESDGLFSPRGRSTGHDRSLVARGGSPLE